MNSWHALKKLCAGEYASESGRRVKPRIIVAGVSCDGAGRVLDVSATGLRISTRKRLRIKTGVTVPLKISSALGQTEIMGTLVWSARKGLFRHEHGFELDIPAQRMDLFRVSWDPFNKTQYAA